MNSRCKTNFLFINKLDSYFSSKKCLLKEPNACWGERVDNQRFVDKPIELVGNDHIKWIKLQCN